MHRRPSFVALAAASVLALSLAAQAAAADPVKLTYWSGFTGGDKQAYEDLIKKFNDTHPDIQIDYQLQPWDSIAQKLPTSIARAPARTSQRRTTTSPRCSNTWRTASPCRSTT